jgi:type I restriction-modification system DNA methylase subunit
MAIINREMRENADAFILRWRGTTAERAEAQTFTNEFFQIFGLDRKNLAQFEKPIQKKDETGTGFADLFWSGKLIIESKSAHLDNPKHWDKTLIQAEEYIENLLEHQRPQFIMLMNFKRIKKYEVLVSKTNKVKINFLTEVPIESLAIKLDEFTFFIEFANRLESDEEKVNQEAARRIANVYDAIERKGYSSTDISILLARILFCLFAEDTGIFDKKQFENYIREKTTGKTLGDHILALFETLNTPVKSRKSTNKDLNKFPYVNGDLFDAKLNKVPPTTNALHEALLDCCSYDWSDISPVIFGSLFQAVMNNEERRTLGAHYTSEKNILRVVRPLFLDKLQEEFDAIKSSQKSLENFRKQLNELTFLDPACGCGNFLVVTYRELRLLDIEIIRKKYKGGVQLITDSGVLSNVPLSNFYGYEIDPTSAMIAEVAMWLTQHQMNMRLESEFGKAVPTIPLHEAAIIKNENSLHINWAAKQKFVKGKGETEIIFDYILGNPPFVGKQYQTEEQKKDISKIFNGINGAGVLDYVACWYVKAAEYMKKHPAARTALVSTNSITQGEQKNILWNALLTNYKIKIQFAHQTFKWHNEAEGVAGVHCVVIGFGTENLKDKLLFEYDDIKGNPKCTKVKNINPYLVAGKDFILSKRRTPICDFAPPMVFGSMPNDGGNLLLTPDEKTHIISTNPSSKKFIKKFIGSEEFLYNKEKYCLWLVEATPSEIKANSDIYKRVQKVRETRKKSKRPTTNKLASTPHLFGEIRQPKTDYIIFPEVTSEKREYIPVGMESKNTITSNKNYTIASSSLYVFGMLSSKMHITWTKYVCGRLESRFQYSTGIVYNNYPWPVNVNKKKKELVEAAAQIILDVRNEYLDSENCIANLYDVNLMPNELLKAHQNLDKLVDKCYLDSQFTTEPKRIEYLFELYNSYTSGMFPVE